MGANARGVQHVYVFRRLVGEEADYWARRLLTKIDANHHTDTPVGQLSFTCLVGLAFQRFPP